MWAKNLVDFFFKYLVNEIDEKCGPKILWIFFKYLVDKIDEKSGPKILWIFFKYLVDFPIFLLEIEEKKSRTPFFLQYLLVSWTRIVDL